MIKSTRIYILKTIFEIILYFILKKYIVHVICCTRKNKILCCTSLNRQCKNQNDNKISEYIINSVVKYTREHNATRYFFFLSPLLLIITDQPLNKCKY